MLIRRLVPAGVDTPTAPLHPEQVAAERAYPDDLGDSVTVRYRNHATGSGRETVHGLQRGSKRLRAQQDVRPSRYPDALQSALVSESGRDFTENGAERDTATYLHDPRAVHWARHTAESGCAPTRTGTAAACVAITGGTAARFSRLLTTPVSAHNNLDSEGSRGCVPWAARWASIDARSALSWPRKNPRAPRRISTWRENAEPRIRSPIRPAA